MKTKLFKEIGLNQNEAEAYKALLEAGKMTPPELAAELKITRQNAYTVVKVLEELGLAQVDQRCNKLTYVPGDPQILESIVQKKIKILETSESQLDKTMPELQSFYNLAKDRPGFSTFSGLEGVQRLYNDTLKREPDEILLIFSDLGKNSYLSAWLEKNFLPRRLSKQIRLREIVNAHKNPSLVAPKEQLCEKKYVEMTRMPLDIDILIYDDNVTFIKYDKKEPSGFTLDDTLVFFALKAFFEAIWARA